MTTFSGGNAAFTPSATNDNWTLDGAATGHCFGKVVEFSWGGSLTSSTGYRTRWTRPTSAGTGSRTAITLAYNQPFYTSAGATLCSTYGSSQPTLAADPSGNLHRQDWNGQGGLGYIALPLANPWWFQADTLQGAISCRNTLGTDANASSYGVAWDE